MMEFSLMHLVLATTGVLVTMALICCLCCLSMKFRALQHVCPRNELVLLNLIVYPHVEWEDICDLRMKCYIVETAKKRGIKVDPDKLDPKRRCQSPLANENCTIIVPEVAIIL